MLKYQHICGAFLFFFLFCLSPVYASEQRQPNLLKDFTHTGLLRHANESADEILLRAHQYETSAIALTIAGYRFGVGGFPQNKSLALAWSTLAATRLGLGPTGAFFYVLSDKGSPLQNDDSAEWLAACEYGKGSRFAITFKEAGLFDIDKACAEFERYRQQTPGWKKEYEKKLEKYRSAAVTDSAAITRARELVNRPMTKEDEDIIHAMDVYSDSIIFFIATSHHPEKADPDWSYERLVNFIATHQEGENDYARKLTFDASEALLLRLSGLFEVGRQQIQKAHAGDSEAAAFLAMRYLDGGINFPVEKVLSVLWLRQACESGDPRYAELRAFQLYTGVSRRSAWPWAKYAEEFGDTETKNRIRPLLQKIESEYSPKALEKDYGQWLDTMREKYRQ